MRSVYLLLVMVLLTSACGKKGALIYPDMLVPAAPANVSVRQVGSSIKLAFKLPDKDKAGQPLMDLSGVKILRRETTSGQDSGCNSCANDFRVFKAIYVDHLDASIQRFGSTFMMLDSDVRAGSEYAYRVLAFTKGNVSGEASRPVQTALVQAVQPPVLQALPEPTEVKLEFTGQPPLEGVLAGYNLYRTVKGDSLPFLALNKEPLANASFIDAGLERGVIYVYAVRMVVRLPKGELVESILSNEVEAGLSDDE